MKIWVLSQVLLKKQNLYILHWVKFLIKDWIKKKKKEGHLKRLKNIEDRNEELLKTTKNKTENIKEITDSFKESLGPEAKALVEEIRTIKKKMLITKNLKLLVVTMLRMILVIKKHLKSYLMTFIVKK